MRFACEVTGDALLDEKNICTFTVDCEGKKMIVVSFELEAIKDYLFIRKGQKIFIDGIVMNGILQKEKSMINIERLI